MIFYTKDSVFFQIQTVKRVVCGPKLYAKTNNAFSYLERGGALDNVIS